jgi:hypothetical protein
MDLEKLKPLEETPIEDPEKTEENIRGKFYNDVNYIKNKDTAHVMGNIENRGYDREAEKGTIKKFIDKITGHEGDEIKLGQKEADEMEKLKLEQFKIGEKLFSEMEKAAANNKVFNLLPDGKPAEGYKEIKVSKMENNGSAYSVLISIESHSATSYPMMQINIDLQKEGNEIHVIDGPYGGSKDYGIQALDLLTEKLAKQASEYRSFPVEEKEK